MRRRRNLSREERAQWEHVARQARPMHDPRKPRPKAEPAEPDKLTAEPPAPPRAEIAPFGVGARANSTTAMPTPSPADALSEGPVRMDRKAFNRLKGGKLSPEARIDLHGMTLAQAHPALMRFILDSQASGRRLVLVITGKGRGEEGDGPIPQRRGVLKRQVPHWLHQPPLAQAVLQVAQAHRRHGGDGAYYVYLRRPR